MSRKKREKRTPGTGRTGTFDGESFITFINTNEFQEI